MSNEFDELRIAIRRLLMATFLAIASTITVAQVVPEPRIRYGVVGRPVCEDYLKLLSQPSPKSRFRYAALK